MGMGENGNRDDAVLEREWVGWNGNGNDSMGVGREWEQESHSCTALILWSVFRSNVGQ